MTIPIPKALDPAPVTPSMGDARVTPAGAVATLEPPSVRGDVAPRGADALREQHGRDPNVAPAVQPESGGG